MEAAEASRYWCHMCSRVVNPILEIEAVKCPICQGGFIEEMANDGADASSLDFGAGVGRRDNESQTMAANASSLWAPVVLSMMTSHHPMILRRHLTEVAGDGNHGSTGTEPDRDDSELRRRRSSSTTIIQLLHPAASLPSESGNSGTDRDGESGDRGRGRGHVIFINPFGQTIVVHGGSYDQASNETHHGNPVAALGALGDYYFGPSLDMLLQHLAENDPNRYGTPPAQREAVEALPTAKVEETFQCPVCLDDCETGTEAKEMPCRHRFHEGCILPWLELHSSCPVCRYQLPFDESKLQRPGPEGSTNNTNGSNEGNQSNSNGNHTGWWFRPFGSLFSSFTSQPSAAANSSPSAPSGSSTNAPPTDQN